MGPGSLSSHVADNVVFQESFFERGASEVDALAIKAWVRHLSYKNKDYCEGLCYNYWSVCGYAGLNKPTVLPVIEKYGT